MLAVLVSNDFPISSMRDVSFHSSAFHYSCVDWDGFGDHIRDIEMVSVISEIFQLRASLIWVFLVSTEFYN